MKGIPDKSIDLVLTDPPYQVTACKWDSIIPLEPMWKELKRITKDSAFSVFTSSQPFTTTLISSNIDDFKYCWVWEKNRATNFPNAKRRPLTAHEDIVVFTKGSIWYNPQKTTGHTPTNSAKGATQGQIYNGNTVRNYEGGDTTRYPRTVIRFDCERGFHPTQKPVTLMEYLIKTYSNEGDVVLDFTMGSSTTAIAALNTNRSFIGIEKDENYFNIGVNRVKEHIECRDLKTELVINTGD
jgi:site-specific DNA-methyltransferase (adenine-specific)